MQMKLNVSPFGNNPQTVISLNHINLEWSSTLKYLGCYFECNSWHVDVRQQIRKYYGNFNNIMAVLRRGRNEMAAAHLIKMFSN